MTRRTSRAGSRARRHIWAVESATDPVNVREAVAILESAAVALAAPRFTEDDIAEVRSVNHQMAAELQAHDYECAVASANRFHAVFHRRCPNLHLLALLREESSSLAARCLVGFDCSHETTFDDHERLVDLIETGAGSRAIERHVRAHCGPGDLCMVRPTAIG